MKQGGLASIVESQKEDFGILIQQTYKKIISRRLIPYLYLFPYLMTIRRRKTNWRWTCKGKQKRVKEKRETGNAAETFSFSG